LEKDAEQKRSVCLLVQFLDARQEMYSVNVAVSITLFYAHFANCNILHQKRVMETPNLENKSLKSQKWSGNIFAEQRNKH